MKPVVRWFAGNDSQTKSATTCVLVDAPIENDRRVQRVIAEHGGAVVVLDVSAARSTRVHDLIDRLHAGWLVAQGLRGWRRRRALLQPHLGGAITHPTFAGMKACFGQTAMAVRGARALRSVLTTYRPTRLHANDLTAGLSVALARPKGAASLVYDAHELEIHRHRRAGWLRVLVEHAHESRAIATATEVRTVNRPIAEKLRLMYPGGAPQVVLNDLFQHHLIDPAPAHCPPALAYVGTGSRGRRLERLTAASRHGFAVHTWLLAAEERAALGSHDWQHGADDYEPELVALVRARRTLMWCGVDTSSLSYRLALPNKFFQALAVCVPVVASRGSYLAELVERYGIGVVEEETSFEVLSRRIQTDEYLHWVRNVMTLRTELRSGAIAL